MRTLLIGLIDSDGVYLLELWTGALILTKAISKRVRLPNLRLNVDVIPLQLDVHFQSLLAQSVICPIIVAKAHPVDIVMPDWQRGLNPNERVLEGLRET